MKLLLTNYDPSEYKVFEQRLNELSSKGYNSDNIDRFTFFKQDNQHYYYQTDIFVPDKSKQENNHALRNKWLMGYMDRGFEYIGKSGKIYVFRSEKKIKYQGTSKYLLGLYFKRNRTWANVIWLFIAIVLTYFLVPNVFINLDPNEFISNGSTILHFAPLLLCISLLCRFFYHNLETEKIKNQLTKNKSYSSRLNKNNIFIVNNWLFIIALILIIAGFGLDYFERKNIPVSDDVISLETLGYSGNQEEYDSCVISHSFLIEESLGYVESNGEQFIRVNYYTYSSNDKAKNGLEHYLQANNYDKSKAINSDNNVSGYLFNNSTDENYNCIGFVKDKQLIIIQSNIDLQANNLYQQICLNA
ncbi:DUF2812 domain-containing protein [uncultured Thomasclavelia sp.]|uniref:DUF2812 domain-containing protein n=1 Tax=uncultured Thomasclavelia sp. TaxID=3025759 RepID=UPI0025E061A1|nr:DUF2812 domain-containing protein [uncultured Thomasclavelia sp.]